MATEVCSPKAAKDRLSQAVARFQQEWDHGVACETLWNLCEASLHADGVIKDVEANGALDRDTRVQLLQLQILLTTAKQALTALLEDSDEIAPPPDPPPHQSSLLEPVFPSGTIIDCPACGEGLYKVTQQAFQSDLILDDGSVLVPLNQAIPTRHAWSTLVCPLCGGRLLKDGKIHTLQYGWR